MRISSAVADRPGAVAGAALTVLAAACAAAVALSSVPAVVAAPVEARVSAAYQTAPTPVQLSFPAPPVPAEAAAEAGAEAAEAAAEAGEAPPTGAAAATAPPVDPPPAADPLCSGDGWEQRRGAAAIASLRRPADAAAVPMSFRSARPGVLGLAHLERRSVEVFVRPCSRQSDALLRHVVAHELGHVLDVSRMDDASRAEWRAVRGIPAGTPWFGCSHCSDFATPAGDFAETYAQWQRGARDSRSQLAPPPSPDELEQLARRFFAAW